MIPQLGYIKSTSLVGMKLNYFKAILIKGKDKMNTVDENVVRVLSNVAITFYNMCYEASFRE